MTIELLLRYSLKSFFEYINIILKKQEKERLQEPKQRDTAQ